MGAYFCQLKTNPRHFNIVWPYKTTIFCSDKRTGLVWPGSRTVVKCSRNKFGMLLDQLEMSSHNDEAPSF